MESVISRTIGESIRRTIVHHYDFVIRIVDSPQVTEALCKPFVVCVVCAHDHRDPRQVRVGGKGNLSEDSSHDVEGELWASVTSREPKIPVFDLVSASMPFIRPGKDKYSSAAPCESTPYLPFKGGSLGLLTVSSAVQTDLRQQQWAVTSKGLQTCKVGLECILRFEIYVETEKVEEREFQKFGCRKIHISNKRLGVFSLCHPIKLLYEPLDLPAPQPTHNSGRDFITHGIAKHSRVTGALPYSVADTCFNRPGGARIIQECDVLFPWQSHHDSQVGALCRIQKPTRWDTVGPDGINSCPNHGFEVLGNPCRVRILSAVLVRPKGTIRDTTDIYLLFANEEKFSPHLWARGSPRTGSGLTLQSSGWAAQFLPPIVPTGDQPESLNRVRRADILHLLSARSVPSD